MWLVLVGAFSKFRFSPLHPVRPPEPPREHWHIRSKRPASSIKNIMIDQEKSANMDFSAIGIGNGGREHADGPILAAATVAMFARGSRLFSPCSRGFSGRTGPDGPLGPVDGDQ